MVSADSPQVGGTNKAYADMQNTRTSPPQMGLHFAASHRRLPSLVSPMSDVFKWHAAYRNCQSYFKDRSQHDAMVQGVATLVNIRLPFQQVPSALHPIKSPSSPSGEEALFLSLVPYVRRLVVTGFDTDGILHSFFGDDWKDGVGPTRELERRNYLFMCKSVGWAKVKYQYDIVPDQLVPFMRPLRDSTTEEIEETEKQWSAWLAMEDWMIGPRDPNVVFKADVRPSGPGSGGLTGSVLGAHMKADFPRVEEWLKNKTENHTDKIASNAGDEPAAEAREGKSVDKTTGPNLEVMSSSRSPKSPSTSTLNRPKHQTGIEHDCSDAESICSTTSSSSFQSGTPSTSDRQRLLTPALDASKLLILQHLMSDVHALLNQNSKHTTVGSGSDLYSNEAAPQQCSRPGTSSSQNWSKRPADREPDSEGENGGDTPAKRPKKSIAARAAVQRKLACPFFQRSPSEHQQYRSCAGPGWTSCHRIKEHIYRRHSLPIRCDRCGTVFSSHTLLSDHHREPTGCEVKDLEFLHGISQDQERQLKSRKRTTLTEEEKWKEMYCIIFPDDTDDMIPSPYYAPTGTNLRPADGIDQYEQFLSSELPALVRRRLEAELLGASEPLVSQLRRQLIDIVRDCQEQLFRTYASRTTHPIVSGDQSNSLHPDAATETITDLAAWQMPPALGSDDPAITRGTFDEFLSRPSEMDNSTTLHDSAYGSEDNTAFDSSGQWARVHSDLAQNPMQSGVNTMFSSSFGYGQNDHARSDTFVSPPAPSLIAMNAAEDRGRFKNNGPLDWQTVFEHVDGNVLNFS